MGGGKTTIKTLFGVAMSPIGPEKPRWPNRCLTQALRSISAPCLLFGVQYGYHCLSRDYRVAIEKQTNQLSL